MLLCFLAETSIQSCFCLDHSDSGTFIVTRHTPYSLGARPLENRKGGSGKWGGVEVYTAEWLPCLNSLVTLCLFDFLMVWFQDYTPYR